MTQNSSSHFSMEYQTERLILKVLTPDYAKEVCDFLSDNSIIFEKYESALPTNYYTPEHQSVILSCELKLALKTSTIRYYVFEKSNPDKIIGTVCLHDIRQSAYSCCEIGYKFDQNYWHKGYATEAVTMGVSIAFAALGLHRVYARVLPDNTSSIRLLERISFVNEGVERQCVRINGIWQDHLRFSIINES